MKKLINLLILSLSVLILNGQTNKFEYLFSHEIETKIAEGEMPLSRASFNYTCIGNYRSASQHSGLGVSWGIDTTEIVYDQLGNALNEIIDVAKDQQIVIISESHILPQHRIFSKQIIDSLSHHGFHHLGMETLGVDLNNPNQLLDSLINKRGYPLTYFDSGPYTKEPQMSNLVRSAISNGYELFGYERGKKIPGKDRDEIQADQVIRFLDNNKEVKKIILHCGWYHAIESDVLKRGKSFWLAKYLKDKTGIDPVTIYQDNFTEKSYKDEHPILRELNVQTPKVFMVDGKIKRISKEVDIEVIHPRTRYINNRPSWLYQTPNHHSYAIDSEDITIDYPVFVKAYLETDSPEAVPIDVVEIRHKYERKPLVLPSGKYRVVITNKKEEITKVIVIE